jgi:hypothetical protein
MLPLPTRSETSASDSARPDSVGGIPADGQRSHTSAR